MSNKWQDIWIAVGFIVVLTLATGLIQSFFPASPGCQQDWMGEDYGRDC